MLMAGTIMIGSTQKYLNQVMFIVVNDFIPNRNVILRNGSKSTKVCCVPVGNYEISKENSYHRVFDDDGKLTCSKLTENIMPEKRKKYRLNKTL